MDARKRGANVTEEQKTLLLQFMEKHPCLMSGKFSADFTYKDATILWQKLTDILNSCNGVSKDWKSWRKCWQDLRSRSKLKQSKINAERRKTGGGSESQLKLSKMEEATLNLISPVCIDGHVEIKESEVQIQTETEINLDTDEVEYLDEEEYLGEDINPDIESIIQMNAKTKDNNNKENTLTNNATCNNSNENSSDNYSASTPIIKKRKRKLHSEKVQSTQQPTQNLKLLEPIKYILQVPGKQIRAKLAKAFNYWLKISDDRVQEIDDIVNMLHNSSLLIDDIQDNSILRRGIPVAHSVYGIASSLSAANYVLFIALERVINLQHPAATKVYTEQLLELHRGQGMDIFWRDNFICPSEEDYKTMIKRKTGGLFNLAVRLMKLFSTCEEDFSSLIATLGLYFQIRDDYCNLCLGEYTENKSYCEDLTEGKFSFPIIHALRSNPDDRQIINILRQRTKDIEVKRHCIKLLERFGSFKYTRDVLEDLDWSVRNKIEDLGGNPLLVKILDELKNWDTKEPKNSLTYFYRLRSYISTSWVRCGAGS